MPTYTEYVILVEDNRVMAEDLHTTVQRVLNSNLPQGVVGVVTNRSERFEAKGVVDAMRKTNANARVFTRVDI